MDIGEIPGRDAMRVGIDDETGQIWISRTKFGGSEREINDDVETVRIDREDLPKIIQLLQDAQKHDA